MTDRHHTIHIDHDPEPTPKPPTDQMLRAQHVLESLDAMRSSGASVDEQVRYLHQNLPSAEKQMQEPSSIADRLAQQERLKADFNELRSAMVNVMAVWNQPEVLPEDVRTAGFRLLKHLDVMRQEAEKSIKQDWKSEVGMLSEVWESAPDLSAVFETTPPRRHHAHKVKEVPKPLPPEEAEKLYNETVKPELDKIVAKADGPLERFKEAVKEPSFVKKIKEAAQKATDRAKEREKARHVPHKLLHEPLGPAPFGKKFTEVGDRMADEMAERLHQEKDWKKIVTEEDARISRDEKLVKDLEDAKNIIGDPSKIKLKLPELGAEASLEPPTPLTIETWTEALNELVVSKTDAWGGWEFDMDMNGTKGDDGWPIRALTWKGNGGQVRLHRQATPAGVKTRLEIYLDGVIYTAEDLIVSDEEAARHRNDPASFIKEALNNPTK